MTYMTRQDLENYPAKRAQDDLATGLHITYADGTPGVVIPVGWMPDLKPKPYTTPDLDEQAGKATGKKGGPRAHVVFAGIPICIENPAGTIRSGVDATGARWAVRMHHHYGFAKRTWGVDGDGVDVFLGPNQAAQAVWIINQTDPQTGAFDEHKVMLGFDSQDDAVRAYHANFEPGWRGCGEVVEHTLEDFKDWLRDENATRSIAKAEGGEQPIPQGAHWITVHPNGPGTKGQPLLIQPIQGSKGAARVVGGAGGKLNGLRLHGMKDPAKWKEEAQARAKDAREKEKARKASLTPEQLQAEKEAGDKAKAARRSEEEKFIQSVLGTATGGQGGDHQDLFSGEEDPKVAEMSHKARLKEAMAIVKEAEKKVLLDSEARAKSGLSVVGGDAPMDLEQILSETRHGAGPGYDRALAKRAEANGLTADKLMEAVAEIKGIKAQPKADEAEQVKAEQAANIEIHKATKELQASKAAALRDAIRDTLEKNEGLAHLLKARQALRQAYKMQVAEKKGIVFEPGYRMAVSSPGEHEDLVQGLQEQLLTKHVQGFLEEIGEAYPENSEIDPFKAHDPEGMHASRGAGAFDLLHDVGLATMGQGVIDRDVVEALGPEGAAQIVARAIRKEFRPEDQEQILAALEHHHLVSQEEELPKAVEEAQALRAKAAEFDQQLHDTPRDLAAAVELQQGKIDALKEARRVLGGNLGRLESRAALIATLRSTPVDEFQVPLGRMTPEKAVQTAAALGLKEGGYHIEHTEGEAILTMNGQGMDSLIKPVDTAFLGERELAATIKQGMHDEENWLPPGFANRQADRYSNEALEPHEFQRHHGVEDGDGPEQVKAKMQAWMGARLADGEKPEDIVAHAYGGAKVDLSPEAQAHWEAALQEMVPLRVTEKDEKGNPIQERDKATGQPIEINGKPLYKTRLRGPSEVSADLEPMMKGYMDANPQEAGQTLNGQRVEQDANFHEALHRAIAQDPRLAAAYIPEGELTHDHHSAIRDFFYREHFGGAADSAQAKKWKFDQAVEALGPEPEKTNAEIASVNLFGGLDADESGDAEGAASEAWVKWNNAREALAQKYGEDLDKPTLWESYIKKMGGLKFAQGTIQDLMRSRLNDAFHGHYQKLTGKTLHMEAADISGATEHLKHTLGEDEAAELEAKRKSQQAKLQKKGGAKFKKGKVGDKIKEAKAAQALAAAEGGSLFDLSGMDEGGPDAGDDPDAEPEQGWEKPELQPGERFHLGTAMENQLRSAMPYAAKAFEGRKGAVKIDEGIHMGGKYSPQQRAIKAITKLKRMGLFYGAGSGKSGIMLGSLTTLQHEGKLKKGILAVPSIVQGQFGAEAIRFIDPTSGFQVHAQPGESYEDRLAAYKDPEKHAVVVTHQTLRDDTLKILGDHLGGGTDAARELLMTAPPKEAAAKVKEAFSAAGIDFNALMVDEAHGALDRDGKEDSVLSKVIDAHSHNSEYAVMATGDPLKNDVSEVWSNLNKIDPHRYPPESRDEFMRRYKNDAPMAKRSMAQELGRYWFNGRVDVGKECYKSNPTVPLTEKQHGAVSQVELAAGKLRTGAPDAVKWAKMLAPGQFEGKAEAEHAAIAEKVRKGVGTFREAAMNRIINLDPEGGKMAEHIKIAKERIAEGKPVVIFAHNLEAVGAIHSAMEKAGLRVTSLSGKDSSKDKAVKAGRFQNGDADVIVMSDAGATGVNLQRGKVLIHHDTPATAMVHNQRTARIHRLGQTDNVESITLQADHAWERKNWERVKKKAVLGEIFQDPNAYLDDTGLAGDLKAVRARAGQGRAKKEAA